MERALQAPGFRFHPTDVELVMYYLKRKVLGRSLIFDAISVIDVYKYDPNDLPDLCSMQNKDLKWYFFCPRERKYASGARMNRATESGYWKTTGKDRPVLYNNNVVGMIKTLIFHRGKAPKGDRTDWVMHEYRLEEKAETGVVQDSYVLCIIFQKDGPGPRNGAQYGAPFREEDWIDGEEDDCIVERLPAIMPLPSRAPEHVRIGSSIESCVSDVVPSSSKELQLATRNNVILPARMPGPNNTGRIPVAGSSRAPERVHFGSSIESCVSDVVPSSSKELQLATRNNVIHLISVPSSSRGSPSDSHVSIVVARAPSCEAPQPVPIDIVHAENLQSSVSNQCCEDQCCEDGSFTVNGSNTNEGIDYVNPNGNEIADSADLSDGINIFSDLGDLNMDFLNTFEFDTVDEFLAAAEGHLELTDLDVPLNHPNGGGEDECFRPDPAVQDPSAPDPANPLY